MPVVEVKIAGDSDRLAPVTPAVATFVVSDMKHELFVELMEMMGMADCPVTKM